MEFQAEAICWQAFFVGKAVVKHISTSGEMALQGSRWFSSGGMTLPVWSMVWDDHSMACWQPQVPSEQDPFRKHSVLETHRASAHMFSSLLLPTQTGMYLCNWPGHRVTRWGSPLWALTCRTWSTPTGTMSLKVETLKHFNSRSPHFFWAQKFLFELFRGFFLPVDWDMRYVNKITNMFL